jgi:GH18 family chitinase
MSIPGRKYASAFTYKLCSQKISWVYGQTNLTEIDNALDLLRRNNIDLGKVNLGMAFYGRTYTLLDSHCVMPGCEFSDAGLAGDCSGEPGILSFRGSTLVLNTS